MADQIERIVDAVFERGRKATSGEPLFFDRHTLTLTIQGAMADPLKPSTRELHRCGVRGFVESGDDCPGCLAENRHPKPADVS